MEYAPFWLMAGLVTERMLIGRLEQLQWSTVEDNYCTNTLGKSVNGTHVPVPPKRLARKI